MEQRKFEFSVEKATRFLLKIIVVLLVLLVLVVIVFFITKNIQKDIVEQKEEVEAVAAVSHLGPGEVYYYNLSQAEKELLAKLVWVESGTESFECQVAIAAVVLNRYTSGISYFDTESVTSVIRQKYQFAQTDHVDFINETSMEAVEAACKGWDPTRAAFPEGALYFYAPKLMPDDFQKGVKVYRIDDVNFHRDYRMPD